IGIQANFEPTNISREEDGGVLQRRRRLTPVHQQLLEILGRHRRDLPGQQPQRMISLRVLPARYALEQRKDLVITNPDHPGTWWHIGAVPTTPGHKLSPEPVSGPCVER